MDASSSSSSAVGPSSLPNPPPPRQQPNIEHLKRRLLKHDVQPTPKILHNLHKKELQKSNRRRAKHAPAATVSTKESQFQLIKSEYKRFTNEEQHKRNNNKLVGRPWERLERLHMRELVTEKNGVDYGDKLNFGDLRELSDILECDRDKFSWLLDNDVEAEDLGDELDRKWAPRNRGEGEAIKLLVNRLSETELSVKDWKFSRVMKHSGLQFTEGQMLRIVAGLGDRGQWRHALSVVEWVYSSKEHKQFRSRFVYTKLLTVLGRARKPREALKVFNWMRGDAHVYPDMAAYHSLAVTLGQAGSLKDLLSVIEVMKQKPRNIQNMRRKNWDPALHPDIVIYNSVLNACVTTQQWKGVSWVFQQMRKNALRPNGASFGLAMEVMLQSGKYDLVHEYFDKMKRSGEALKGLTYKVLVKAFWQENKANEAVQAVRDMERRGVVGTPSVYYELARCLCFYGRWQEATVEIKKLKKLRPARPLAVTFTGMILSSMDGGHVHDCLSIFEHFKTITSPDIGIINAMLKVYGKSDMFLKAKELFEEIKVNDLDSEMSISGRCSSLKLDAYTFGSMLEASASAQQWEYFEYVYKEMVLSGYQLDQNKHSALLLEASRAGKEQLLQHAFDTILEAGEIPPMSFFTELVCQATAQHNFERAVSIVNTMAHAPFQVSFQEWIDLFEMNTDRIEQFCLAELHNTLGGQDLVKEVTVFNLSRALQSLNSTPSGNPFTHKISSDVCEREPDDGESVDLRSLHVNTTGSNVNHKILEGDCDWEKSSDLFNDSHNGDARPEMTKSIDKLCYEFASNIRESDLDDLEFDFEGHLDIDDELEDIVSSNKERESGTPSAYEILENWKEMRKDRGKFLSPTFQ